MAKLPDSVKEKWKAAAAEQKRRRLCNVAPHELLIACDYAEEHADEKDVRWCWLKHAKPLQVAMLQWRLPHAIVKIGSIKASPNGGVMPCEVDRVMFRMNVMSAVIEYRCGERDGKQNTTDKYLRHIRPGWKPIAESLRPAGCASGQPMPT